MIDPSHLMEMTIYSKLINETSNIIMSDVRILYTLAFLYFLYKNVPQNYYDNIMAYIHTVEESFIVIPSHKKTYHVGGYSVSKEITKIKYSPRFKAIHHFLLHTCSKMFSQMYEIMEIDDVCKDYSHTEQLDFILMPFHNKKELICPIKNIYLEISVSTDDTSEEKNEKVKKTAQSYKQYSCKISTPGSNPSILQEFIDDCVRGYKEYVDKNTYKQVVFEYSKTEYDDNDKRVAKYIETPFVSNKYLDKNIFFPEKEHFLTQVNKFVYNKDYHRDKYMQSGQTYKLTLLLYGEPGTGKTCILRGLLNHTKRDAIWIPWSNVKTCSDLSSILRATKFNGKPRQLKDVIFIFEDFDANSSKVLKKRKLIKKEKCDSPDEFTLMTNTLAERASDLDTPKEILDQIKSLKEFATNMLGPGTHKIDDELTLEYALNMFDGIVEQDDAIIAFTTNHIEDIDPAVFRPGRVDYMLELKNIEEKDVLRMLKLKYVEYEECNEEEYVKGLLSGVISAARVQMEILKEESLELGLKAIRKAMIEAR